MFSAQLQQKWLSFSLELDNSIPPVLNGDALRLSQVLINLLSNAIKFTERGSVSLTVSPIGSADNCLLQFTVTDTGIGISEAQQERLFTAFSQADSSISRKYGGTGLGLAISAQLAQLMGGRAWAGWSDARTRAADVDISWVLSVIAYLACVFSSVFMPWPQLGLPPHLGEKLLDARIYWGAYASVSFVDGGRGLIFPGPGQGAMHLELERSEEVATLRGHAGGVTDVAAAGNVVASVGGDCTLRLWDPLAGREAEAQLEGEAGLDPRAHTPVEGGLGGERGRGLG